MPINPAHTDTDYRPGLSLLARIVSLYQYLLPQHLLSALAYRLARLTWRPFKDLLILAFIRIYKVDMSVAEQPDPKQYKHFNDFFTRRLKASARPVDKDPETIVSPVDGIISQAGKITDGKIIQAKGIYYSVPDLLGGNQPAADTFSNGQFITLYLSPRDYHRIHMPVTGTVKNLCYVPGKLFSVSPASTRSIDKLFTRNERIIQIFETGLGDMALVMVGAVFVGSMETVWAGQITPVFSGKHRKICHRTPKKRVTVEKGAEIGRFNMGSTVILLFGGNRLAWLEAIQAERPVRLGQVIGRIRKGLAGTRP